MRLFEGYSVVGVNTSALTKVRCGLRGALRFVRSLKLSCTRLMRRFPYRDVSISLLRGFGLGCSVRSPFVSIGVTDLRSRDELGTVRRVGSSVSLTGGVSTRTIIIRPKAVPFLTGGCFEDGIVSATGRTVMRLKGCNRSLKILAAFRGVPVFSGVVCDSVRGLRRFLARGKFSVALSVKRTGRTKCSTSRVCFSSVGRVRVRSGFNSRSTRLTLNRNSVSLGRMIGALRGGGCSKVCVVRMGGCSSVGGDCRCVGGGFWEDLFSLVSFSGWECLRSAAFLVFSTIFLPVPSAS